MTLNLSSSGHKYQTNIKQPTCSERGYTTYTCECGDSYKDNYTDIIAHTYSTEIIDPTCSEKGYTLYTCECGDSYKDNYTNIINHTYQEEFNVYRLIVNKDGMKKVASCDYNRIKDFCNFINNLWVYYMAMNWGSVNENNK